MIQADRILKPNTFTTFTTSAYRGHLPAVHGFKYIGK